MGRWLARAAISTRLRSISVLANGWAQSHAKNGDASPANTDEKLKVRSNCSAAARPLCTVWRRRCNATTLSERAPHSHATRANVDSRPAVGTRAHATLRPRNANARAAQRVATG